MPAQKNAIHRRGAFRIGNAANATNPGTAIRGISRASGEPTKAVVLVKNALSIVPSTEVRAPAAARPPLAKREKTSKD
jgi:hypothetical protein